MVPGISSAKVETAVTKPAKKKRKSQNPLPRRQSTKTADRETAPERCFGLKMINNPKASSTITIGIIHQRRRTQRKTISSLVIEKRLS